MTGLFSSPPFGVLQVVCIIPLVLQVLVVLVVLVVVPVFSVPVPASVLSSGGHGLFGLSVAGYGGFLVGGAPYEVQGAVTPFDCTDDPGNCVKKPALVPSDGVLQDEFGVSVSLSSVGLLAVGSWYNDVDGKVDQGKVYLFDCGAQPQHSECVEVTSFTPPAGAENDNFGTVVSMSGSMLVVSSPFRKVGNNVTQGEVYLYDCSSRVRCALTTNFTSSDGMAGDKFGSSVSMTSGNLVAVGSIYHPVGNNSAQGKVYLFDCSDIYHCIELTSFSSSNGGPGDWFGYSVSISGMVVVVGAPKHDEMKGGAYLFDCGASASPSSSFSSSSSSPRKCVETILTPSEARVGEWIGASVSVDGNLVVVGSPWTLTGSAYVFDFSGGSSGEYTQTTLVPHNGVPNDWYGMAVAVFGDQVAIGSPYHKSQAGLSTGAIYLYGNLPLDFLISLTFSIFRKPRLII